MSEEKKPNTIAFSTASSLDQFAYQSFTFLIFTFYFTIVGINVILIFIAFVIWSVWNALNDPILGSLSDRTHTRWGRRIPWIMASIIPLGVIMILLYTPPISLGINDQMTNFVYFLMIIIIFEFFYTMFSINQTSLFPEMFIEKDERGKVNVFRQIFIVIGLIAAFILPTLFIPDLTDKRYLPNYWIFSIVACTIIISMGFIFLKWGVHEKEEFRDDYKDMPGFLESLKICVKNKSFLWPAFSLIMVWFVFGMVPVIIPLYGKFVLGIENSIYISLMLALAFISAAIFVNVWRIIAQKLGVRKAWMCSMLIWIITMIPLMFISKGDMILAFLIFFLIGIGFAGALLLRDLMWADVIDEDEIKTGVRREAAYYGVNALFMRLSTILVFLAISLVFSTTGWGQYTPNPGADVIFGLRILMVIFPIIALGIAIFGFYMYPLHGERLEKVKEAQRKLHERKKRNVR